MLCQVVPEASFLPTLTDCLSLEPLVIKVSFLPEKTLDLCIGKLLSQWCSYPFGPGITSDLYIYAS